MPPRPPTSPLRQRKLMRVALAVIGLSPLLLAAGHALGIAGVWAAPFQAWFSFQCHTDPERSFWFGASPLPVCSRCLGIYFGLAAAALLARPRLELRLLWAWVLVAAVFLMADVATEAVALRPPFAPLRFALGLTLAYPVALALTGSVRVPVSSEREHRP